MKKYLQTPWMRILSSVICTISIVAMIIASLGYVMATEYGGTAGIYRTGYEKIAEAYGLYAVDMLECGYADELQKEFAEKQINCNVSHVTKESNENGELVTNTEVLFHSGAFGEEEMLEITIVPGSVYHYNVGSLLGVLYDGVFYCNTDQGWTDFPIEGVVFDTTSGLFYYQTSIGFYEVEEIVVEYAQDTMIGAYEDGITGTEDESENGFLVQAGESVDYTLRSNNGEKKYVNGYYDDILDTENYRAWSSIIIQGWRMEFGNVGEWANTIEIVSDGSLDVNARETNDYEVSGDYISAPYVETQDVYQVQVSCAKDAGGNLFDEWSQVALALTAFYSAGVPMFILSLLVFVCSFVMMIYSAKQGDEELNFMEKLPVFSYSGAMFLIETGVVFLIVQMIEWFVGNNAKDMLDVVVIVISLSTIATWLALNWFQNIVTRIKCKRFWKTSELYYLYHLLKKSWDTITKPIMWCWTQIKKPFQAIITACKRVAEKASKNIPLFKGGIVIFVTLSVIETWILVNSWVDGAFMVLYLLMKVLEFLAWMAVLYQIQELHEGSKRVAAGDMSQPIDTNRLKWKFREHGENINKVSDGIAVAVEERMKSEHFKTELITNVSHDIKTPLTSIINYVDLIKKEDIANEKAQEYIDVLDRQSARLKKLIEDLMEASKASTGNLAVNLEECNLDVLLTQVVGEFEERLEKNQLVVVIDKPEHSMKMMADGRHLWRIFDNLLNNACKYSLPGTRVYVVLKQDAGMITISFKNISKDALNIPSEELMERFVRGDSSRNTEGSGLGLSIAQSLTELMKGNMKLDIDGDLFKVTLTFPAINTK